MALWLTVVSLQVRAPEDKYRYELANNFLLKKLELRVQSRIGIRKGEISTTPNALSLLEHEREMSQADCCIYRVSVCSGCKVPKADARVDVAICSVVVGGSLGEAARLLT